MARDAVNSPLSEDISSGARRMSTQQHRTQKALDRLEEELECIKQKVGIGWEVRVEWHPGEVKIHKGRRLKEWVDGETIHIFVEKTEEAFKLVRHGFIELILGQHLKPWRRLMNKIIEAYEEQQHDQKEPTLMPLPGYLKRRKIYTLTHTVFNFKDHPISK